jgi:hypothetical protein
MPCCLPFVFVLERTAPSGAAENHKWIWDAGPEKGTQFWQGPDADHGGHPVGGAYTNWLKSEPNDDGGLGHYAHIFVNSPDWEHAATTWNDMPNVNTFVQGYTVEYGGMLEDAPEDFEETITIHIGEIAAVSIEYPQMGDDHNDHGQFYVLAATAFIGI